MLLLTVATNLQYAQPFLRSCQRVGAKPWIVGEGQAYYEHMCKYRYALQALISLGSSEEPVLFVDSYDALMVRPLPDIEAAYLEMAPGRWLFSTEHVCWPDASLSAQYPIPPRKQRTRYLNSGVWVCPARRAANEMIIWNSKYQPTDNDQTIFTKAFLEHPEAIVLDYDCKVSFNLNLRELDFGHPMLFDPEHTSFPCIVHGSGPGKQHLHRVQKYLGIA